MGHNGARCGLTEDNACCLTVSDGGTFGVCMPSNACPSTSIVLRCDDEEDCPGPADEAGRTPVCCLEYQFSGACVRTAYSAHCLPYKSCGTTGGGFSYGLCKNGTGCQGQATRCQSTAAACDNVPNGLPNYFLCQLPLP